MIHDYATLNQGCYRDVAIVRSYEAMDQLFPAEAVLLKELRGRVTHGILDVGVGTGRTTPFLRELSPNYLGIDYSEPMIRAAQARHPGVCYQVCDMRELRGAVAGRTFDLIMIAFNGLDYVSPEERMSVLRGVFDLLSERGQLLFSSHHLNAARDPELFRSAPVAWTPNPLRLGVRGARALWHNSCRLRHYVTRRRQRSTGQGYAVLNDEAHDYRLMTYYVEPAHQACQLREIGFQGRLTMLHPFHPHARDLDEAPWLYYAVGKRPEV